MARNTVAPTRATTDALQLLGGRIRAARIRRGWTLDDAAARVGADPRTWSAMERGAPGSSIGTVFNAAFLVGVPIFGLEGDDLAQARRAGLDTLALLPSRVRARKDPDADLDF